MKPPTLMCSTSAGESTGTRAERYTVGTIWVGCRETIEQIESFHPASDHIATISKKVVGGDGEVTQSCAALVYGRRRRGRGVGLRLTNLVVPGGVGQNTRIRRQRALVIVLPPASLKPGQCADRS